MSDYEEAIDKEGKEKGPKVKGSGNVKFDGFAHIKFKLPKCYIKGMKNENDEFYPKEEFESYISFSFI